VIEVFSRPESIVNTRRQKETPLLKMTQDDDIALRNLTGRSMTLTTASPVDIGSSRLL